jgi:hypothetical protein
MYNNFNEVREEIRQKFYGVYAPFCQAELGYVPEVYFDSLPTENETPDNSKGYGVLQITSEDEKQVAISANVTEPGKRKFEITGIIIFQLFLPKTLSDFENKVVLVCHTIKKEFRKPNDCGIWFRGCKVKPLPSESLLGACNFYSVFNYNEVS